MFDFIITGYRWMFLQIASVLGPGWAIVSLSFICSALMAPLMKAVGGIVRRESDYQSVINPQLEAIKAKYASDMDRHFHIQRLYSRYSYSPLSAVKKVLPLFVQIPFLLLTYYMLKGTVELNGVSFLFLSDLGKQDALLSSYNVLPLLMTGVNALTVFASSSFTAKDRKQALGIAFLFLVLLYAAPSALLLYWTLNNTITLVRTLVEKRFIGARALASSLHNAFSPKARSSWAFFLIVIGLFSYCVGIFDTCEAPEGLTMVITTRGTIFIFTAASLITGFSMINSGRFVRIVSIAASSASISYFLILVAFFLFARDWYRDIGAIFTPYQNCLIFLCLALLPYLILAVLRARGFVYEVFNVIKGGWCLFLLPMIVGIHYSFSSQGFQLSPSSVVLLMLYLVIPAAALSLGLMLIFRHIISSWFVFRVVLGFVIAYYLVPMVSVGGAEGVLSSNQNVFVRILLGVGVATFFVQMKNRGLLRVFISLLAICVIANSIINNKQDETVRVAHDRSQAESFLTKYKCVCSNNVYLLMHDGYAQRVVRDGLNMDRSGFHVEEYLKDHGFTVYETYCSGSGTIESMNEVFTIAGISGASKRSTISGDSVFNDFLKQSGYRTCYVTSGYLMPMQGERMPADDYFPKVQSMLHPEWVLFGCILKGSLSQVAQTFNGYTADEWISVRNNIISSWGKHSNFIYAHLGLPGHCIGSSRYRKSNEEELAAYIDRLDQANEEIRREVELIERLKDDDAIVIMASDHGGFVLNPSRPMYADARHLLDRHGTLLAVRWPKGYVPTLNLNVLENILLEVMICLSADKSLAKFAVPGITHADIAPLCNPPGLVVDGICQSGPYKGMSIFGAAKATFKKKGTAE